MDRSEIERLMREAVERERARCVEVCRQRAALWRRTELSRSEIAAARDEARARANEAGYIADALATLGPTEAFDAPSDAPIEN